MTYDIQSTQSVYLGWEIDTDKDRWTIRSASFYPERIRARAMTELPFNRIAEAFNNSPSPLSNTKAVVRSVLEQLACEKLKESVLHDEAA